MLFDTIFCVTTLVRYDPSKRELFDVRFFNNILGCSEGLLSLGRVFGELRLLWERLFLFGRWPRKDPYYRQPYEVACHWTIFFFFFLWILISFIEERGKSSNTKNIQENKSTKELAVIQIGLSMGRGWQFFGPAPHQKSPATVRGSWGWGGDPCGYGEECRIMQQQLSFLKTSS